MASNDTGGSHIPREERASSSTLAVLTSAQIATSSTTGSSDSSGSHDSKEAAVSPATQSSFTTPTAQLLRKAFHISDGDNLGGMEKLVLQPDSLRQKSLVLRKIIDEANTPEFTQIKVKRESRLDIPAVKFVLENLERGEPNVNDNAEALAVHCALLWEYECDPGSFTNIGDSERLRLKSDPPSVDQQNDDQRVQELLSWYGEPDQRSCGHSITIALVLRRETMLKSEIKLAVWGTKIEVELMDLFNKVQLKIIAIEMGDKTHAKSIKAILKEHQLGDYSKEWKENADRFEEDGWTPFYFMRGIRNALGPEPRTVAKSASCRRTQGKDSPRVDVANVRDNKIKGRMKRICQEKKNGILESLEELIDERSGAIAAEGMVQRDNIVLGWRVRLAK